MKKILAVLLCALLTVSAVAFADTFTATGKGFGGSVTVTLTIEGGKLTDVEIDSAGETPAIGQAAAKKMAGAMLKNGTIEVDGITGATYTSNAIKSAAAAALAQSGVALKAAAVEPKARATEDIHTQLLVVGGGFSGMVAAITASGAGIDTLLIEKTALFGGAGAVSGGAVVVTGSEIQKKNGVTDDTPEDMFIDLCENGDYLNNMSMLKMYTENIAETIDRLTDDIGVPFLDGLVFAAEYKKDRVMYPVGLAAGLNDCLVKSIEASPAKTMLETRATELIVDAGRVIGVKASGTDTDYNIYADAVLMATGGYGYAKDLLPDSLKNVLYYGPAFATGDGQRMVMAVDARFDLFDLGKIYPNGVEVAEGRAKSTIWPNAAAFAGSGILVDLQGERIVNEKASNDDLTQVLMEQPGRIMYVFMDADSFAAFRSRAFENAISDEEIDGWLENNGSCAPVFAHAGTVEEVCAIAGMDAEGLKATIDRYNGFVATGMDEDFGRPAEYLKKTIGEGPYYIVEQKPRFATTMGGVVLTGNMEVLNKNNEVIPGLYACGEMANLVHGSNSACGANVSWALTGGYLAGNAIAAALGE